MWWNGRHGDRHAGLTMVLSIVASGFAGLAMATPAAETGDEVAVMQRLAAVEARLAALGGEHAGATSDRRDGTDLEDLERRLAKVEAGLAVLESLDARLARIERHLDPAGDAGPRVASLDADTAAARATSRLAAQPSENTATLAMQDEAESSSSGPVTFHDDSLFLPSRGRGGGPLHYGDGSGSLELHAFLDLEYTDAGADGDRAGVSTFDNHHANIFLRAALRPNLTGHIEIEYEHAGDVVEIDQAFLSWAPIAHLTLDAGRFYTPFGIERFVWYSPTNALVSRPQVMRQIVPGNFYAGGLRGSGLFELAGDNRFTYEVAVTDGLGDDALTNRRGSRQTRDNNSSRAVSGRVSWAHWPWFEIGTSVHRQRYADDADLDLAFTGFDIAARYRGFELRAEYVDALIERLLAADLEQDGWYAELAYVFDWDRDFLPQLKLVGRLEEIDLDQSRTDNGDRRSWSLGINAQIYERLRIKGEYQRIREDGAPRDDDAFRFQMVLDF